MGLKIGLERLLEDKSLQNSIEGNIAFLCHSASITSDYQLAAVEVQKIFKDRLKKIFGPQHGFVTDVQDNMVETSHGHNKFLNLPIYSLYSETRNPTDEMLQGIDHVLVDLFDVGTRVYTYQSTMLQLMKECGKRNIKVTILDRPNPIGGTIIEGPVLNKDYESFVGRLEIPQRHGLSLGELALFGNKFDQYNCDINVIECSDWTREETLFELNKKWTPPSPNLPTLDGAFTFVGTVLFEGTNISEGRGTTRSLEIAGHPHIEPFTFHKKLEEKFEKSDLKGFKLRPIQFLPTFQKHQGITCGGVFIHITDHQKFRPWSVAQVICREFYLELKDSFEWNKSPYEYEYDKWSIDLINGGLETRDWIENDGSFQKLTEISKLGHKEFIEKRNEILIYR